MQGALVGPHGKGKGETSGLPFFVEGRRRFLVLMDEFCVWKTLEVHVPGGGASRSAVSPHKGGELFYVQSLPRVQLKEKRPGRKGNDAAIEACFTVVWGTGSLMEKGAAEYELLFSA